MDETTHGVGTDKAQQPQNEQNDGNGIQHGNSPCATGADRPDAPRFRCLARRQAA
jgi:hypothetical protein